MRHGTADCPNIGHQCIEHQELVLNVTKLLDHIPSPTSPDGGNTPNRHEAAERALTAAIHAEQRIAQLQRRIEQLEKLVVTDELTGLLNRRGFELQLQRTLDLARRYGEPGLLVYVDLDGFKMVNDTYGHAAGDEVLKHVASVLSGHVRSTDFVGRLGGDEFALLLPRTNAENGTRRIRELDAKLNPGMVFWNGGVLNVGASIGIEPFDGDAEDGAETVISRADCAMYAQKRLRTAADAGSMMA